MAANKSQIKETLNGTFERAILAVGYSVSNRIMLYMTNKEQKITPAFIVFTITWAAALIYINSTLLKNTGIQISLSILISNLITSIFPSPEGQKSYFVFPSILFYLILTSSLCWLIDQMVQTQTACNALWNRIVPFLVLFTSAIVLKIVGDKQQMKLLHLISICYIVIVLCFNPSTNLLKTPQAEHPNFFITFLDSIMCRSLVLCIQDYAKSSIDNMDVAVIVFNACIVCLGYYIMTFRKEDLPLPSQVDYFLGVLIFTISQQLFRVLQQRCNDKAMASLVTVATVMACLFYNRINSKRLHNVCILCLGMAWSLVIELWLCHFYSLFEHLFVYLIIFIAIQNIQETMLLVYDFTENSLLAKDRISAMYGYETIMVIPHEGSSAVGLPHIQ